MSYKCDKCNEICFHSELKKVTTVRDISYNKNILRFNRDTKKKEPIFNGSFSGWEIVKESRFCKECYDKVKDNPPTVQNQKNVDFIFTPRIIKENTTNKKKRNDECDKPDMGE